MRRIGLLRADHGTDTRRFGWASASPAARGGHTAIHFATGTQICPNAVSMIVIDTDIWIVLHPT